MSQISYILAADGTLNIVLQDDGTPPQTRVVPPIRTDHINRLEIIQALKEKNTAKLYDLIDIRGSVVKFSAGRVKFDPSTDELTMDDKPLAHGIQRKIIELKTMGLPFNHLLVFLDRLYKNPSKRAVTELYSFLEHRGLPITEDGCILGYKRFRPNWTDAYSGTIRSELNVEVRVDRNTVDDNWGLACSEGLHIGAPSYVARFHEDHNPPYPIGIVKFDPADVVTVPTNETNKLRTCAYTRIGVLDSIEELLDKSPVYSTAGGTFAPVVPAGYAYAEAAGYENDDEADIEDEDEDEDDNDDAEEDEEEEETIAPPHRIGPPVTVEVKDDDEADLTASVALPPAITAIRVDPLTVSRPPAKNWISKLFGKS